MFVSHRRYILISLFQPQTHLMTTGYKTDDKNRFHTFGFMLLTDPRDRRGSGRVREKFTEEIKFGKQITGDENGQSEACCAFIYISMKSDFDQL